MRACWQPPHNVKRCVDGPFLKTNIHLYYWFIYFLLNWDLHCCMGFCLAVASRGYSLEGADLSLWGTDFSLQWLLLLPTPAPGHLGQVSSVCAARGLQRTGSVVVGHSSCSTACGIFPTQESNPCFLHWQVDSLPLSHQGSLSLGSWN